MNKYEKLAIVIPAIADVGPFSYYAIIMPLWRHTPLVFAMICSFAPPVVGVLIIVALPLLAHWRLVQRTSNGFIIGAVLGLVGIIEPVFFWI